ncbi:hypothetical protein [Pseudonocardia sp. GCM10023141]|uniref:hypothetical protein n=1 Tax=Pseudonocardia sp. GCM10023141 TaxID=3252653 RepID=UPI00362014C9
MLVRKLMLGAVLVLASVAALPAVASAAPAARSDVLTGGTVLTTNKSVHSADGRYTLVQQSDGNLVLYSAPGVAAWSTRTQGVGVQTVMQTDGNLVVYSALGKALYNTETGGNPGAVLAVQNDGNLVIYSASGVALWSRHVLLGKLAAGGVLEPGDVVRSRSHQCYLGMQGDGNVVLNLTVGDRNLWSSRTAGNPGARLQMQGDGNLVLSSASNKPIWDSATGRNPGAWLGVQDDCNAVVYGLGNKALWSTGTHA